MGTLENFNSGDKILYMDNCFSGNYNQQLYIKRAIDDGSNRPKFYISVISNVNGSLVQQGYLYFYLDFEKKESHFIGVKVEPEFRNLNIASFLVASWIDLCLNNGYDFLGVNHKQKKPFLLYLLKTYGFEVSDLSLYETRNDVISICQNMSSYSDRKFLLFKDVKHEKAFMGTNIFKTDNYEIIHDLRRNMVILDNVIIPLQNMSLNHVEYSLQEKEIADIKTNHTLSKHRR